MANYIIVSNANSFVIQKGVNASPYSRNDLRITFSSDNDKILKIYDKSVNNYLLHQINLDNDTVDVDGVTVFSDAQDLYNALEPIFYSVDPRFSYDDLGRLQVTNGTNDLSLDAWGRPKSIKDKSLFSGLFTSGVACNNLEGTF